MTTGSPPIPFCRLLYPGACFGEIALLIPSARRAANIVAQTFSEAQYLTRNDLFLCLQDFPAPRERIQRLAEQRLNDLNAQHNNANFRAPAVDKMLGEEGPGWVGESKFANMVKQAQVADKAQKALAARRTSDEGNAASGSSGRSTSTVGEPKGAEGKSPSARRQSLTRRLGLKSSSAKSVAPAPGEDEGAAEAAAAAAADAAAPSAAAGGASAESKVGGRARVGMDKADGVAPPEWKDGGGDQTTDAGAAASPRGGGDGVETLEAAPGASE